MIFIQGKFGSRAPTQNEREIIKAGVLPMQEKILEHFKTQKNRFFIIAAIVIVLIMLTLRNIRGISPVAATLLPMPFVLYIAHILADFDRCIALASTKLRLINAGEFVIKEEDIPISDIKYDAEGNILTPKSIFVTIDNEEHFVSTFIEGIEETQFTSEEF